MKQKIAFLYVLVRIKMFSIWCLPINGSAGAHQSTTMAQNVMWPSVWPHMRFASSRLPLPNTFRSILVACKCDIAKETNNEMRSSAKCSFSSSKFNFRSLPSEILVKLLATQAGKQTHRANSREWNGGYFLLHWGSLVLFYFCYVACGLGTNSACLLMISWDQKTLLTVGNVEQGAGCVDLLGRSPRQISC